VSEEIEKLQENQSEILQIINNGLKSKVEQNCESLNGLESRFNKLLLTMGGGMFAIILLLIQILVEIGGG